MRLVDDRLAQYARILRAQAQPQPGDNMFEVAARQSAVLQLSLPIMRGFQTNVAPAGSAADPVQESCLLFDTVSKTGAVGLDSHNIGTFSPGLWHIEVEKAFHFTGTTNQATASLVQLVIGATVSLGTQNFSANLLRDKHYTGLHLHSRRDLWLPMLDAWQLNHVVFATVAGDALDDDVHIVARRFF